MAFDPCVDPRPLAFRVPRLDRSGSFSTKSAVAASAETSRDPSLSSCSLLIRLPRLKHPHLHTCLRHCEHVLSTRIASPCFARLKFKQRLSSRAPPDSTKRDPSTRSNWSRLQSITMYSTLNVLQCTNMF